MEERASEKNVWFYGLNVDDLKKRYNLNETCLGCSELG